MSTADAIDEAPGSVKRIGQLPNWLACAHELATTPLFQEKRVFVVFKDVVSRHQAVDVLRQFSKMHGTGLDVMEWTGSMLELPAVRRFEGVVLADQGTIGEVLLPSPQSFERVAMRVGVGDVVDATKLKSFFAEHGYDRDATANMPGRWAARGEVVDIHLLEPYRVLFDGDEIESIAVFDLETGKTGETVDELLLPPLSGKGRSMVFDHLQPGDLVVVVNQEPFEILQEQIVLDVLAQADGENAGYKEQRAYHMKYEEMVADAGSATEVLVFTAQKEKAKSVFESASVEVRVEELDADGRGFTHEPSGLMVFTDQTLGFAEEVKKKKAQKVRQAMLQSMEPGDFVVHLYHGIARFGGMTTMHVNELDREYFVLEYAERDKIYVPVELAERVDKYLGDPNPTIHRLTDSTWNEVVGRVKAHALEMARQLLDLYARRSVARAPQMVEQKQEEELEKRCEFELTPDQKTSLAEIFKDLEHEKPMDRLLCGDVGFGKTELAIRAAYRAVLNGYQVAVLAPTTVLVQQHYDTFESRLKEFGVSVNRLSRLMTPKQQDDVVAGMKAGTVDVVIGTHRLLSADIDFRKLGLIVVDEEQRFGVRAKEALKKFRSTAHVLSMTATPIPRTLHLSLSGIRDISTILTPPSARKAVETRIERLNNETIKQAVALEMARNGQTYYLYNRVRGIMLRKNELEELLPDARIGVAHGQMKPSELAEAMHAFDTGKIDVLLATTIVENGLDIPSANTLIVENASMFGLSDLYQLKGRVGRSDRQGYAYFFYKERELEDDVKKRFVALQEAQELGSGFELAMKDMEIRGVGNILGKEQHGNATKIGLNLYVRLLNQAVQELEGIEAEPERDIPIDLPIEARIPENLLPDESDRILLYQQLANIRDIDELRKKREEYVARAEFSPGGTLHPALSGLFDLLEVKLLAARSTLLSIDTTYPNKQNRLESPRITLASERIFMNLTPEWEHMITREDTGHKVRATVAELGENWLELLKTTIKNQRNTPSVPDGARQAAPTQASE